MDSTSKTATLQTFIGAKSDIIWNLYGGGVSTEYSTIIKHEITDLGFKSRNLLDPDIAKSGRDEFWRKAEDLISC